MVEKFDAVFVSPHLDDAVFSCGGTIAKLTASNKRVLILNVFTKYPYKIKKKAIVSTEARYEEERRAAQYLSCKSENLDELSAIFRRSEYSAIKNLFRPPVPADQEWLPKLSALIADKLDCFEYTYLYAPLGVGWHVDHVLCHLAVRDAAKGKNIFFYEDAPYCLIPHWTEYRLRELGVTDDYIPQSSRTKRGCVLQDTYEALAYYATMMPLKNFKPAWLRLPATLVVGGYFLSLLHKHGNSPSKKGFLNLNQHVEFISASFEAKITAANLYESQIHEFFVDRRDCKQRYEAYAAHTFGDAHAERCWVARRPK